MSLGIKEHSGTTHEDMLRILSNIDQVVFSMDMVSYTYRYISASCEKVYGYTQNDFASFPLLWSSVIHPDDRFNIEASQAEIAKGDIKFFQYRIIHKNGDVRWVDAKVIPKLDTEGILVTQDVVVTDITDRKIAQLKLEVAHSELNRLFNSIDEVLYSVDMISYKLIHMSAACLKVYGYTPDEFHANENLWKDVVHPDDIGVLETHVQALTMGEQVQNQYRIYHKDGTIRWLENKIVPAIDATGTLIRIDGITSDITHRKLVEYEIVNGERLAKLAEANLKAIIENTEALIYSIDSGYRYITFNNAMKASVKLNIGVEIQTGDSVFGFLEDTNPQEARAWKEIYDKALTGTSISFEKDFSTKDIPGYHSFSITPIWENEHVIGLSCFSRDITRQKLSEQEILSLNQTLEQKVHDRTHELEQVNAELESFSYSISHDLRAPLRVIHGFGNMLIESCAHKLDEEEMENLTVIMKNSKQMGALIDDLLNFSRLGRQQIEKRTFCMDDLVRATLEEAKMCTVGFKAEVIQHLLGTAQGDPSLLRQVWGNLISNAIKYSARAEHARIEIGTVVMDGFLTYYVKDNGAGFDMQYADKLFAVFQRLHKVTEYEGTGVGLALSHRIISKHSGRIWAQAEPNKGATFYFTLPTNN